MHLVDQVVYMPKVELHLHLDGAVRPETMVELAISDGVSLPTLEVQELKKHLHVTGECSSLSEYLSKFELPLSVLQTQEALEQVAYELCESLARERVRYFEVRFAPYFHTRNGLTLNQIVQAVLDGLNEGQIEFNMKAGLILSAMRHHPVEKNLEIIDLCIAYKEKGVVGIDLAGDEANFPLENQMELFQRAKESGLKITIHAGEATGPASVLQALDLGADRIGHGVSSIEDAEVMKRLADTGVMVEACPTSNVYTRAVEQLSQHPIKTFFSSGIKVSINTDNPTVSNTSLTQEYLQVAEAFDFSFADLKEMVFDALQAAFCSPIAKERLLQEIKTEFTNLEAMESRR